MVKKMLTRTVIIIFILAILGDIGLKLIHHYETKKINTEHKKIKIDRIIEQNNEILQAREDFLKEKAEKGNKLKYESRWEKPFKKQFDSKLHCEIPDDIKVMYDGILYTINRSSRSDVNKFLLYTYDRTYSKKRHVQDGMFIQAINLWSKEQMKFKDIKTFDENCEKLAKFQREKLLKYLKEIDENYFEKFPPSRDTYLYLMYFNRIKSVRFNLITELFLAHYRKYGNKKTFSLHDE